VEQRRFGVAPGLLTFSKVSRHEREQGRVAMKVRDVMSRDVMTIETSASCHEAAGRMFRGKVRHLPVVDRAGALAGIVTDRDLRHRLLAPAVFRETGPATVESVLKSVPVAEIMSKPVTTTTPDEDLAAAARIMLEDKVGALPVVADGRVVGILTETDLLRQIVRSAECCCPDVPAIVVSFP
jgi:CBS domain-containing protein